MSEIDEKDLMIISELKKDARLSEKKLAQKTKIPITTIHNRLKKLFAAGVIKGSTLIVDYLKLGKNITAFVLVRASSQSDQKELLDYVAKLPNVYEAAMITGEFDILFKTRVESMEELKKMVVQGLRKHKSVTETRTMISYETIENT